jgi:LCP family protein required for cell wall assembly
MSNLFLTILGLTVIGSIAVLCVILLNKMFGKNYSRQWTYIIWLVIAIRLIIPVNINIINFSEKINSDVFAANHVQTSKIVNHSNDVNIGNEKSIESSQMKEAVVDTGDSRNISVSTEQNKSLEADSLAPQSILPFYVLDLISYVWAIGVILFLLYHLVRYYSFRTKILRWSILITDRDILEQYQSICKDMGIKRQINILRSNQVYSPMLLGFIKPRIVLPVKDFTEEQYHFVLKHELIHYKHHDLFYKLILLWTAALHWFNPFVHYMVYRANNDIELFCDEKLIAKNNLRYRENYSNMMLHIMTDVIKNNNILLTTGFGNSKKQLKNRFYQIMNSKPTKRGTCFIIGLVCLIIVAGNVVAWLIPAKTSDAEATDKAMKSSSTVADDTKDNTTDRLEKTSNILVVGVDGTSKEKNLRADSILVVRVNPDTKTIALVSFLRDMYLEIPAHGKDKLCNVYQLGGTDLIKDTIETNFDLVIDHEVTVHMDAFEKVIDSIGGVEIELSEKEAQYLNSTNYISIKEYRDVSAGKQKLNGNQALGYLRVRNIPTIQGESSDLGRTARLRGLLTCVINECSNKGISELTKVLINVIPSLSMDMNLQQLLIYLNTVLQGEINTDTFTIPVKDSYTAKVQDNMSVLDVDLNMNKKALQNLDQ